MKTAAEIRRHIRDLMILKDVPCDCAGTEHEGKCQEGYLMMVAAAGVLSWALGEHEQYQEKVNEMRAAVVAAKQR